MLGLWSYAPMNLLIVAPNLPPWLPNVILRDLQVGGGNVSIRFKRNRQGRTDYHILDRSGSRVHVLRQPPPDDLDASPFARIRELGESLLR